MPEIKKMTDLSMLKKMSDAVEAHFNRTSDEIRVLIEENLPVDKSLKQKLTSLSEDAFSVTSRIKELSGVNSK